MYLYEVGIYNKHVREFAMGRTAIRAHEKRGLNKKV
jgi:hypothetical protein